MCNKVFIKCGNRGVSPKYKGAGKFVPTGGLNTWGEVGRIFLYREAEPFGRDSKFNGAEILLKAMNWQNISHFLPKISSLLL